jgi:hypothetical protein
MIAFSFQKISTYHTGGCHNENGISLQGVTVPATYGRIYDADLD